MIKQKPKVWVEINKRAIAANFKIIKSLVSPRTKIWSVVKSNAYGQGIVSFSNVANAIGVDGFCVDSVVEALKLRKEKISKPILVLGPTLPYLFKDAADHDVTVSVSSWTALTAIGASKIRPQIHIKIDTGMHRQGFFLSDLPEVLDYIKSKKIKLTGIFSHFASAKDINYPSYTEKQFAEFTHAISIAKKAGFTDITAHIAATGGTLLDKKYHLDAVRIGIGLYGIFPSKELEMQLSHLKFQTALSWHALVSEVKTIEAGEYIGYDLVERLHRKTEMAIIPIGYWHGLPWALSGIGQVLIRGQRAKILGRVSMDMITVDVTGLKCKAGDEAVIIGKQGKEEITAREIAQKIGTTPYEIITRINPLIERIVT